MFKPQTIISILSTLSTLCLMLGGIATLIFIFYCFENASAGIPMVIMSLSVAIFGSVTCSAMAIIIAAVDSIALTNKRIAETLDKQNISSSRTNNDCDNSLPPM